MIQHHFLLCQKIANKGLYIILWCQIIINTPVFGQNNKTAQAQHQLLNMPPQTGEKKTNNHPLAAWFPKAGFGLFIHWGAIADYGGTDISWGMLANKSWPDDGTITPNFYYKLMDSWKPKNFDIDKMLGEAKAAGFQYAVFTTKHHDGYTMWPSQHAPIGTHTKLNHRDFVREFVNACAKHGLKVGLYYSPPDWYFDRKYRNWSYNDSVFLDMDHKPVAKIPQKPAQHDSLRKQMVAAQVRELLTQYGRIDLMWFDGGVSEITNQEVRKLQPGIVINRRNGAPGDFGDSEGALPQSRFNGWFETCDPVWPNRWWSYSYSDDYATAGEVIANLVKLRAWGGNYLANIGPAGDGSIPQEAQKAMQQLAQWMQHSKEAVVDVEGGNYPEKSNVPVTLKKNVVYAFALPNHQAALKVSLQHRPTKAILLRNGKTLHFTFEQGIASITIPPKERTRLPDVVKLIF